VQENAVPEREERLDEVRLIASSTGQFATSGHQSSHHDIEMRAPLPRGRHLETVADCERPFSGTLLVLMCGNMRPMPTSHRMGRSSSSRAPPARGEEEGGA